MNKAISVIVVVLLLAGAGGGGYYLGLKTGEDRVLANPAQFLQQRLGTQTGRAGQFAGTPGAGFGGQFPNAQGTPQAGQRDNLTLGGGTTGTVVRIEDSVVVLSTDNGNVRVLTSGTTFIEKYMSVDVEDLEVGERLVVSGTKDDQGNLVARSIQSMRAVTGSAATPSSTR